MLTVRSTCSCDACSPVWTVAVSMSFASWRMSAVGWPVQMSSSPDSRACSAVVESAIVRTVIFSNYGDGPHVKSGFAAMVMYWSSTMSSTMY